MKNNLINHAKILLNNKLNELIPKFPNIKNNRTNEVRQITMNKVDEADEDFVKFMMGN